MTCSSATTAVHESGFGMPGISFVDLKDLIRRITPLRQAAADDHRVEYDRDIAGFPGRAQAGMRVGAARTLPTKRTSADLSESPHRTQWLAWMVGHEVGEDELLCEIGDGARIVLGSLDRLQPTVSAAAIGMAHCARDEAIVHLRQSAA